MCDNFARELTKIVVAQVCKELGFHSIHKSALETLSDILQKYIEEIGFRSHLKAELASRTESNFNDVRSVLKELGLSLDNLYTFAALSNDIPFNKDVPPFPIKKSFISAKLGATKESTSETNQNGKVLEINIPLPSHIPSHMPPFPEPHTYVQTAVFDERVSDARLIRKRKSKEKRQVETSLAKLNEKLGNKPIINYDTARKSKGNPYLTPAKVKLKEKAESKENVSTAAKLVPTPLQKGLQKKDTMKNFVEDNEDNKKVYSELEESERIKKRQRAEQILSLQYEQDIVDHELPIKGNPTTTTTILAPIVEKL